MPRKTSEIKQREDRQIRLLIHDKKKNNVKISMRVGWIVMLDKQNMGMT